MPPKHLNTILLAMSISLLCYIVHRRARTASMVGEAVELINAYYVDPVERDDLLTAAMNGLTDKLDEHSSYIPPTAYDSFQDSINQEFAGIGIFVDQQNVGEPVRVVTPLVKSPALRAGLKPNDLIVQVDGQDMSTSVLKDVSEALKGPIGTSVSLVVEREGEEELSLTVQRAMIELDSVVGDHRDEKDNWVYRLQGNESIAYMRLSTFGEKTVNEMTRVLLDLNNDFEGLVLDLRDNSGGLLYTARDVSDMFLPNGKDIVSTRLRGGKKDEEYVATELMLVKPDIPIVVLLNENSASASEIVAACLQDHGRAVVAGVRSYGKGTVQNILPLQYGRSALRLTVARYYRPNGKNIHRLKDASDEDDWGVLPDENMSVKIEPETYGAILKKWQEASYPLLATESKDPKMTPWDADPQLKRAVDYLLDPESDSAPKDSDPPAEQGTGKEQPSDESFAPAA